MQMRTQGFLVSVWVLALAGMLAGRPAALADDPPPAPPVPSLEEVMGLSLTQSSQPGEKPAPLPKPVLNVDKDGAKKIKKEAHGTKAIAGDVWKNESLEERDRHLRSVYATMFPPGSTLVITVPDGDIWVIPPGNDPDHPDANYKRLVGAGVIREWVDPAKEDGIAPEHTQVPPDSKIDSESQSDRHGSGAPAVARAKEP
jgi:hypothetical protein